VLRVRHRRRPAARVADLLQPVQCRECHHPMHRVCALMVAGVQQKCPQCRRPWAGAASVRSHRSVSVCRVELTASRTARLRERRRRCGSAGHRWSAHRRQAGQHSSCCSCYCCARSPIGLGAGPTRSSSGGIDATTGGARA
jgi:hypothetical protein